LTNPAHSAELPATFLVEWGLFGEKTNTNISRLECVELEGINITSKRVDWNHEYPCGKIESVKYKDANTVIVSLLCVDEEGWVNGKPRRPRTYRDVQTWTLFTKGRKTLMSQTSSRDNRTDTFEKCAAR
jgi:hypothetical protein